MPLDVVRGLESPPKARGKISTPSHGCPQVLAPLAVPQSQLGSITEQE